MIKVGARTADPRRRGVGRRAAPSTPAPTRLLYELRRKFAWVIVDLPRFVTPVHRVVLSTASRAILLCERSLAGLRDTIRMQTLVREQAPQTRLILDESGTCAATAVMLGKGEFEKAIGKSFDASLTYDPKSAGAAANAGQPLTLAAPRSAYSREIHQLIDTCCAPPPTLAKRRFAPRAVFAKP